MVPKKAKNIASIAPVTKVRTRHANEPFISTHDTASAVSVIHTASPSRPVASPHMMGSVPDKAIRKPQLIIGSKLSFWISVFSNLYDRRYDIQQQKIIIKKVHRPNIPATHFWVLTFDRSLISKPYPQWSPLPAPLSAPQ